MPEHGIRSTYTQCPLQLRMLDEHDCIISTGSGFWVAFNDHWYLITNRHNLTGKDVFTKRYINRAHKVPLSVDLMLSCSFSSNGTGNEFDVRPYRMNLYSPDRSQPLWTEHPDLLGICDIAAISIPRPATVPSFMHNAANMVSKQRIPVRPGTDIFVIGFPSSISVGFGLPIWKAGSIASEPYYPVRLFGTLGETGAMVGGIVIPAFFLDFTGWSGMSGSPVFARFIGNWDMTDPYRAVDFDEPNFWTRTDIALGSTGIEFIGIYGGWIKDPENGEKSLEDQASLSLCWNVDAIRKVCVEGVTPDHPHL